MAVVRLQKLLSERGVASRRKAEELIAGGHVKVNGHVASLGDKVDDRHDVVHVRGKRIAAAARAAREDRRPVSRACSRCGRVA